MQGSLLAQGLSLGILAGLIKVACGALFFQALFECELKQAFIIWPQPWSSWCWERGPATDSPGLLAGADAFLSAMSLSLFIPQPLIPFSTLLLAFNPAVPFSFLYVQPFHLNSTTTLCPVLFFFLSFPHAFPHIFPIILHEGSCRTWKPLIHHFCLRV